MSSYGRTGNGSSTSAPRARPAASELKKKQKEQFTMPMERRRHNILLLLLDDLRDATHLHKMASFHAISQRGVTFTNAHAAGTSCGPSRAALLTGRWPSLKSVCTNKQARTLTAERQRHMTLPGLLKFHGYHVAGAGKVFHQSSCSFGTMGDDTWDEYFHSLPELRPDGARAQYVCSGASERDEVTTGEAPMPEPKLRFCECANHGRLDLAAMLHPLPRPFAGLVWNGSVAVPDARIIAWAISFLRSRATPWAADEQRPFFLAVGLHGAHAPYVVEDRAVAEAAATLFADGRSPLNMTGAEVELAGLPREGRAIAAGRDLASRSPDDDLSAYEQQRRDWRSSANRRRIEQSMIGYAARLAETDRRIGAILDALGDSSGYIARSTVVLLTADHGVHLGEKAVAVGSKWTLWEPTSHVPLLLLAPGAPAGRTVHTAVSLVDVLPTLAEAAAITISKTEALPGRSLLALLDDDAASAARHRSVLVTHCPARTLLGYAVRDARFRYISYASRTNSSPAGRAWTSLDEAAAAGNELYDTLTDPHEQLNLLQAQREWNETERGGVRRRWSGMERALQRLLAQQRLLPSGMRTV